MRAVLAPPPPAATILVMGTGLVGAYLAGRLQAAGALVHCVGRPRVLADLREQGLTVTDLDGAELHVPAEALRLHDRIPGGLLPDLVLLTVKCGATAEAAQLLAQRLPAGTPVLSLQNGIGQAERGAQAAPQLQWLAGMVPYNIVERTPGHVHRGTAGRLAAQWAPVTERLAPLFEAAGLPIRLHGDMRPVQWGKLLLNLNNPVNALSGLPLRTQLLDRGHRQVLAALQREALGVLAAAGIQPAALSPVPPQRLPALLSLPTPVFRLLARKMLRIDGHARSSMADDLSQHRPTEVDALCGAVVRLGREVGVPTPLNEAITRLVRQAEAGAPALSADALQHELGLKS